MSDTTDVSASRLLAGRYTLGSFIGQGGMSTVYRGTDTRLGRQVAIKVMKADLSGDELFRSRFRQEAQSASRLAHPSVVRVLDAGDDLIQTPAGPKRLPFIVMEYVDGHNLRDLLAQEQLSLSEACRVMDSVLTALEYSHRAGIVHRDIKPANIMVTSTGQVKVMDFGIARAVSDTSSTVQQTTAILGTASYFSPEQAKGETVDSRTDLYSAGVLLYELLTGEVPFRGDTAVAVAYQHVSERPEAPSLRNPNITEPLERVILHALAKDRAKRFQSASEFREALKLAADGVMPRLETDEPDSNVLFSAEAHSNDSDQVLRRLSESGSNSKVQNRPPVIWVWAAILTVGAVIVAVVFWLMTLTPADLTPAGTQEMPQLTGVEQEVASSALLQLKLIPVIVEDSDPDIAAGLVVRTDPEAGTRVSEETTVTLYVSTGPETPEIPAIDRMTLDEYTAALTDLGIPVGMITKVNDPYEAKDRVLKVDPAPGEKLPPGKSVNISISSGLVMIPDVRGQSIPAGRAVLEDMGITAQIKYIEQCPADLLIVDQKPAPGEAPQRSEVTLYYYFCGAE